MNAWIVNLVIGGVLGLGFLALARRTGRSAPTWVALGLVVAAGVYPTLALPSLTAAEMPVELFAVAGFGGLALLGVSLSRWFLVLGWALHGLFDVLLPLVTDTGYVPLWYAPACLGFDVALALGIAAGALPTGSAPLEAGRGSSPPGQAAR